MTERLLFPDRGFDAFLFDMDGTLLSSLAAAERVWTRWGARFGLDPAVFLPAIHGVRAADTIRRFAPAGTDVDAEAAWVTQAEIDDVAGIEAIPGVAAFLDSLPPERWAIVTSAPRTLALRRMGAIGLAPGRVFVGADDVARGKPDPSCYRLAAERLGCAAADCLVFEDAPAGIAAAEAAGATVMVITATHAHPVATPHATTADYRPLRAVADGGRLRLDRLLPAA